MFCREKGRNRETQDQTSHVVQYRIRSCVDKGNETVEVLEIYYCNIAGFPLRMDKLENLEKWEGVFQTGKSRGILNRLEKSGKITQNTGKIREFQTNIICYFSVIFNYTVYCLLKLINFSVKKNQNIN